MKEKSRREPESGCRSNYMKIISLGITADPARVAAG